MKDFQKKNAKVGKKKVQPESYTKTNAKIKQIKVHLQASLIRTKDIAPEKRPIGEATTHRKWTVKHCISQLHNYKAKNRSEALKGLRELARDQPSSFLTSASYALKEMFMLLTDEDSDVRHKLKLLVSTILRNDEKDAGFQNLSEPMYLGILSGLTHVSEAVRNDTVKFVSAVACNNSGVDSDPSRQTVELLSPRIHEVSLTKVIGIVKEMSANISKNNPKTANGDKSIETKIDLGRMAAQSVRALIKIRNVARKAPLWKYPPAKPLPLSYDFFVHYEPIEDSFTTDCN